MLRATAASLVLVSGPTNIGAQANLQTPATQNLRVADSAELAHRARDLQATFERRRRQMLPRFYPGTADHCLIVGRFCEWHPRLEDYTVPDEGKNIQKARAELLRDLAKLAAALPGDDWIAGQRMRYLIEAHDTSAVSVARDCKATKWRCDALLGLALHVGGDYVAADSAFSIALEGMPSAFRCHWMNLSPLLDDDIRKPYHKMPCSQREAADVRIWWVADPLFMVPGNERRTEHFARVLHTDLLQHAANTYGESWGGDLAELLLRFGWAEKWTQQPSASMYPGVSATITGHEREPGFHFFLTKPPPDNTGEIVDSLFEIYQFPPREQYAPGYAKTFLRLDAQVARFRRGDSTMIVAAYNVAGDSVFGKAKFAAAVAASADEALPPNVKTVREAPLQGVMTLMSPWKTQLIGVELLAADSSGAARWRSGFDELPLDSVRISVSDLLFVDGAPSLPSDLAEATVHAHGGTKFTRNQKIGLYWELYGRAPADSALPISLTISPVDEGFLKKAFRALRVAPKATPLNIRWQENGSAGLLSPRSVMLDLSLLPAGKYSVKLEAGATGSALASRVIELTDR